MLIHRILSEIELSYARSSGPGGQNVNKVNTKCVLRWCLAESRALDAETLERLLAKLAPRLTRAGELVIACDRFRDQPKNRDECLARLEQILTNALKVKKARKKSRPSKAAKIKRRESKQRHSEKKQSRRKGWD